MGDSIRICIDARMIGPYGIGTYLSHLLPLIVRADYQFQILYAPSHPLPQQKRSNVKYIPFSAPIYSIQEQIAFLYSIPPCDLFWSPHYNIPLGPIRAKKRVVTIHDAYPLAHRRRFSFLKNIYSRTVMNAATRLSDAIITNSHFSQTEIIRWTGAKAKKMQIIPLGVCDTQWTSEPKADATILKKYAIRSPFFLMVGWAKPHKNLITVLQAMECLKNEEESFHLVLVGPIAPPLENLVSSLSICVQSIGTISSSDLAAFYRQAEALIYPSLYEGFGLPPLEAMRCGCPVIAPRRASLPEVCGDAALYINPELPQEIAQAMMTIRRKKFIKEGLKTRGFQRSALFRWENCAQKHLELFEELIFHGNSTYL